MGKEAEYKRALKELGMAIVSFENQLDAEMKKPSNNERGERVAILINRLTLANQRALHFTLGLSFKQIENLYRKVSGVSH
jgi:hypothetical protein